MKRLLTKYGFAVLCTAVLIAVLLSIMALFSSTSAVMPNIAGIIASPFRAVGSAITDTVDAWQRRLEDTQQLQEDNRLLRQKIAEMEQALRQAELDREENERLRNLLGLQQQRQDLRLLSARVTSTDEANWSSVLTLNRGSSHDVSMDDCVIDEYGNLVGVVTQVGLNWSSVRALPDSDTSLGAKIFRSGQTGLAQGNFSLMEKRLLQLNYLGTGADMVTGDLVVTSGLNGHYPEGLVIGEIEELGIGDDGLSQYALLRPEMSLDGLSQVFIITDFIIEE